MRWLRFPGATWTPAIVYEGTLSDPPPGRSPRDVDLDERALLPLDGAEWTPLALDEGPTTSPTSMGGRSRPSR